MQLQSGTFLQGGKYKIETILGQGGFGITYLGWQTGLDRRVAIKEFFMKEYCNRDASTSHVTVGTEGSRELVVRFQQKFVKEAQTIAKLDHPYVVRIYDVFTENDTAYYVMEYVEGGSLQKYVSENGALQEQEALFYIRKVATALEYIHEHQMNHLDVKPDNILRRENAEVVLIDFGLSKRYDESGHQTSTTPVGVSAGYAPMEQYKRGGVGTFSPATDIYSLGATFYKLLTGQTPPDANDIFDRGLPALPFGLSVSTKNALRAAMQPKRSDRPQSIGEFLAFLDGKKENEDTILIDEKEKKEEIVEEKKEEKKEKKDFPNRKKMSVIGVAVGVALAVLIWFIAQQGQGTIPNTSLQAQLDSIRIQDSIAIATDSSIVASVTSVQPVSTEVDMESLYKAELKTATSIYNKKLYDPAKELFNEMLSKYPTHQPELKQWITKCNAALKKVTTIVASPAPTTTTPTTATVEERKPQPISNEPSLGKLIDLGLSVKWASYNVGASSPEGNGGLYGWADPTGEKTSTNYDDYPSSNPPKNISGTQYDIARAKWGGNWRLPKQEEFVELSERCDWKWIKYKGVVGYLVTGPNGNRIFLPAAGWRYGDGDVRNRDGSGAYWSGTLKSSGYAYYLNFYSGGRSPSYSGRYRCSGHSVRPVSD